MAAPSSSPLLALTVGDPAGIGPEVVARALSDPRLPKGFRYEVIGPEPGKKFAPGKSTVASARAALRALEQAADGAGRETYAAIVTGPVQKETIARLVPGFIGQTEWLAQRCGQSAKAAVMVLTDPRLTVALATTHCALRDALRHLTPDRIVYTALETERFLRWRGIKKPKLTLAGINPHAGENGLFGDEEKRILAPALKRLRRFGIEIIGPHSPDTVFYRASQGDFHAVICAYHDQGLIPFKLLAFSTGVNVTLGLPIIRTSPDHGTALDLAGKNRADHRSMLAAIRLATQLVRAKNNDKPRSLT